MRRVSNDVLEEEEGRDKKRSGWLGRGRSPPAGGVKSPMSMGSIDRLISAPEFSAPEISPGRAWVGSSFSSGSGRQERRFNPG